MGERCSDPGKYAYCQTCPFNLEDEFAKSGYPCQKAEVSVFAEVLSAPQLIRNNNGELVCEYSLRTPLREKVSASLERLSLAIGNTFHL
ncbi:MAG: hypothetical protein NUV73_00595 [Candidatus Daviesbacteria bacterium]|nr:hypothetical protein [Candidatus Daviesbacteria bacterium]